MKGTKYMKIFKMIDEENDLLSGVLLYYEKSILFYHFDMHVICMFLGF